MQRTGNTLLPAVIVILAIAATIGVYAFSVWPKDGEFDIDVPVVKTNINNTSESTNVNESTNTNVAIGNVNGSANTNVTNEEAATKDWKTYSNSQAGFSFKYPSNWGEPKIEVSSSETATIGKAIEVSFSSSGAPDIIARSREFQPENLNFGWSYIAQITCPSDSNYRICKSVQYGGQSGIEQVKPFAQDLCAYLGLIDQIWVNNSNTEYAYLGFTSSAETNSHVKWEKEIKLAADAGNLKEQERLCNNTTGDAFLTSVLNRQDLTKESQQKFSNLELLLSTLTFTE